MRRSWRRWCFLVGPDLRSLDVTITQADLQEDLDYGRE
jgi:hypothetical protein